MSKFGAIATGLVRAIIGILFVSAAMNALSFVAHAQGRMVIPATILWLAVPALIFAFTKAASIMFFQT